MSQQRVLVYARLRPPRAEGAETSCTVRTNERGENRALDVTSNKKVRKYVDNTATGHRFSFDEVFDIDASQDAVYDSVCRPAVDQFLEGYNATVFAYGQTGSGKTYTISGSGGFPQRGLLPRAIQQVFEHCESIRGEITTSILVSYVEIYNEAVYDLLDASHGESPIERWKKVTIREDSNGTLVLRDLRVFETRREEEALNLLFLGNVNRVTAETAMNPVSSRSHCVFSVTLEQRHVSSDVVRSSRLHLVDLAGSERLHRPLPPTMPSRPREERVSSAASVVSGRAGSVVSRISRDSVTSSASRGSNLERRKDTTRKEGRSINSSLHHLELVTMALASRRRDPKVHIPYRNSVLTSFLRDSLGGNCRTAFVMTINPEIECADETISTCRFAQRCAQLTSRVARNETRDLRVAVARLEREKAALQARLEQGGIAPGARLGTLARAWLVPRPLSSSDRRRCERWVANFLRRGADVGEIQWDALDTVGERVERAAISAAAAVPTSKQEHALGVHGDSSAFDRDETSSSSSSEHSVSSSSSPSDADRIIRAARKAALREWPQQWIPWMDGTQAQLCAGLLRAATIAAIHAAETGEKDLREHLLREATKHLNDDRPPSPAKSTSRSPTPPPKSPLPSSSSPKKSTTSPKKSTTSPEKSTTSPEKKSTSSEKPAIFSDSTPKASSRHTTGAGAEDPGRAAARDVPVRAMASATATDVAPSDLRHLLTSGAVFLKHGRRGKPHPRFVWCSADLSTVYWRAVGSTAVRGSLPATSISEVKPGRQTEVFARTSTKAQRDDACFSLITPSRTLDLEIEMLGEPLAFGARPAELKARDVWVQAFQFLLKELQDDTDELQ